MRALLAPLILIALATAAPARAQQLPLQTEPATIPPLGQVRLEIGAGNLAKVDNYQTGLSRTTWAGPLVRAAYAPADSIELGLEWVTRVGQVDDPVFGSTSDWGDITLRAKWRFAGQRDGRPAFAVRLAASLPETQATEGLGSNTIRTSVDLLASDSAAGLTWHANLGLGIHDRPFPSSGRPPEQSDFLNYGLALARRVGAVDVVAEVAGRAGEGDPGAESRGEARLGLRYGRRKWRGAAALRHGLYSSTGTWGFEAGLVVVLKPGAAPPQP